MLEHDTANPVTDRRIGDAITEHSNWAVPEWPPVGGCRITALALCATSTAPRVIRMPELRYVGALSCRDYLIAIRRGHRHP